MRTERLLFALLILLLASCSGSAPRQANLPDGASLIENAEYSQEYLLGADDLLEISVFQVDELSGRERVNADGYIRLPLLGNVEVAGQTRSQAEDYIAGLYSKDLLQNAQVNVDIVEYAGRQVTVLGAVERPGVYAIVGPTTLLAALALAGGPDELADPDEIIVFRGTGEGEITGYKVSLNSITAGEKSDPTILGNDRIVVPESGSRSFVQGLSDTLRGFIGFRYW